MHLNIVKYFAENRRIFFISIFHFIITFFTDRLIFIASPNDHLVHYVVIKVLLFIILFLFWQTISKMNIRKIKSFLNNQFPFLILFLLIILYRGLGTWNDGDCSLMYQHAIQYDPWPYTFTYIQGYLYILSYMLIPSKYAVLLLQIVLYIFILGHILMRFKSVLSNKYLAYFFILIAIPLLLTTLPLIPHRIPFYTPLYILFISVIFFDYIERRSIGNKEVIVISLLVAVLSHWRVEGFYLVILFPIILFFAYRELRGKSYVRAIITFILMVFIVGLPQYLSTLSSDPDYISRRSSPIYTWTISTMLLNDLDIEKNRKNLDIIDNYMSIEKVQLMNQEMGSDSYHDEYILFRYNGVDTNADQETFDNFVESSQRIILSNFDVFFKSRVNAFKYLADYKMYSNNIMNLLLNMYIPLVAIFIFFFYSLVKQKWLFFFLVSAVISHSIITFILLPAAYYKYFYLLFFAGWQVLIMSFVFILDKYLPGIAKKIQL